MRKIGSFYIPLKNGGKVLYHGEVVDGKANGFGICFYGEKLWYHGQWKDNRWFGYGTSYYVTGTKDFEGEWVDFEKLEGFKKDYDARGVLRGEGFSYSDDRYSVYVSYNGDGSPQCQTTLGKDYIIENFFDEKGNIKYEKHIFPDTKRVPFKGPGKLWGVDVIIDEGDNYKDPTIHSFVGVKNGYNKIVAPDGRIVYEGEIMNGRARGQGRLLNFYGEVESGQWINGVLKKQ